MIKLDHRYRRPPYLEILTEEQVYSIHSASLEILERIGVKCNNEMALKIWKDGGAYVDGDRVKIPPTMVEEAIRTAPSRSLVIGRGGNGKVLWVCMPRCPARLLKGLQSFNPSTIASRNGLNY